MEGKLGVYICTGYGIGEALDIEALQKVCEEDEFIDVTADLIKTVFTRMCQYSGPRDLGTFVVGGCTSPDQLGDDARAVAKRLADAVTA